jgi:hypothetical protein
LKEEPAVAVEAALKYRWVAAPEPTAIELVVPVMLLVTVSVPVRVWFPTDLSVTETVPVPAVRGVSEGRSAAPSLLVK